MFQNIYSFNLYIYGSRLIRTALASVATPQMASIRIKEMTNSHVKASMLVVGLRN